MRPRARKTDAIASAGEQGARLRVPEAEGSRAAATGDIADTSASPGNYWRSLGDELFCPLAVTTAPGRLSIFARSADGELVCRRWAARGGWGTLAYLGVPRARRDGSASSIAVDWQLGGCAGEGDTVLLFGRSPDGEVLYRCLAADVPGDFECLGAPSGFLGDIELPLGISGPPVVCAADQSVDLFATSYDGQLLHTARRDGTWTEFEGLGTATVRRAERDHPVPMPSMLTACRSAPDGLWVFVRGPAGDLLMRRRSRGRWADWTSLGWPELPDPLYPAVSVLAPLSGAPAACSWGPNRIDVFARGAGGDMLHRWWNGTEWSRFESLGMPVTADRVALPFTGSLTACTWGANRLDVFARALDGGLYHARFDGRWDHGVAAEPVKGGEPEREV